MNKNPLTDQVKALRAKIKLTGLSYRQVYQVVGISQGWFMRMVRGDFHEPNPEWMKSINDFLDGYIELTDMFSNS